MSKLTAEEQMMVFEILSYAKIDRFSTEELVVLQINLIDTIMASREVK